MRCARIGQRPQPQIPWPSGARGYARICADGNTLNLANDGVHGHFVRHMKSLFRLLLLASAVVALAGCASKVPKEIFHAGDEAPPDFLSGPAAMLLTNQDGFSATVASSLPSPGASRASFPATCWNGKGG